MNNTENNTDSESPSGSSVIILVFDARKQKDSKIKSFLEEEGFEPLLCDNVFDALDKLGAEKKAEAALIIADEFSGEVSEMISAIRAEKTRESFPVIVVSESVEFSVEDCFSLGASEYLETGRFEKEFIARVKNLLSFSASFNSLSESAGETRFLFEASSIFNSTLDIDLIMEQVLKLTVEATKSHSGTVFLTDSRGNVIKQILSNNYPSPLQQSVIVDKIMHRGLAGWVFEKKEPGIIDNTDTDPRWYKMKWKGPDLKSVACVPMIRRDQILGVLTLHHSQESYYKKHHIDVLRQIANQAAVSLENSHIFNQLHHLSITDELTGLFNRRLFFTLADKEYFKAIKFNEFLSMMMLDLDDFKSINDVFGHCAGDAVLENVSKIFQTQIRNYDILARYGGDEFAILMPKTHIQGAIELAKKIHREVENSETRFEDDTLKVTLSIGVAEKDPSTDSFSNLLKKSDQALYRAKSKGKNRIDIYC
ncbi:diguanylate cyclase [candidate division WOR-3 bacterium]|nr:diguanylate cyclase [candidate division WOR-3 bacterium]